MKYSSIRVTNIKPGQSIMFRKRDEVQLWPHLVQKVETLDNGQIVRLTLVVTNGEPFPVVYSDTESVSLIEQ